jgi:hypothetical protein
MMRRIGRRSQQRCQAYLADAISPIAASRASSCDEGFLQVREEAQLVMSGTFEGAPLVVFAREDTGHSSSQGGVTEPFYELPIFKRGWCFQERLLAPRTLHFALDELFFQCRTEDRCECSGRGTWKQWKKGCYAYYSATISRESRRILAFGEPGSEYHDTEFDTDSDSTVESALETNESALVRRLYYVPAEITKDYEIPISFGQMWADIVSDYVSLSLTFARDVLPALSGVANLMPERSPGRYFAGLWERDLHYLLGWTSVREDGRCYRPKEATAPSFSWASRFGPVGFPFECLMARVCTVLDIKCEPKGADRYGQVLPGGYIVLQGKLMCGTIQIAHEDTQSDYRIVLRDASQEEFSVWFSCDTEEDEADLGHDADIQVYCFDLFHQMEWADSSGEFDDHDSHSIVLREGDEPGTFRRVGTAFNIPASAYDAVPDAVVKIL